MQQKISISNARGCRGRKFVEPIGRHFRSRKKHDESRDGFMLPRGIHADATAQNFPGVTGLPWPAVTKARSFVTSAQLVQKLHTEYCRWYNCRIEYGPTTRKLCNEKDTMLRWKCADTMRTLLAFISVEILFRGELICILFLVCMYNIL